jgi:hypothetical protein
MSKRDDAWSLVRAGRYSDAAEEYFRCYAEGGGTFALRGRAKALLLAGRAAEARQDFSQVIESTEPGLRSDGDFIDAGTCHWYMSQPGLAVEVWRVSPSAPYTDAAGGVVPPVILLYAATRLGDSELEADAVQLLRGHWERHQRRGQQGQAKTARQAHEDFVHPGLYSWPGALVPFLLGGISDEDLDQAAANSPSDILRARQQCQADFAAGIRALRESNHAVFRDRMSRSACNPHGVLEHEFCLARWEIANGFPTKPFVNEVRDGGLSTGRQG